MRLTHRLRHLLGRNEYIYRRLPRHNPRVEGRDCQECGLIDHVKLFGAPEPIAQVGQGTSARDITGDESPWPMIAVLVGFGVAMAALYVFAGGAA
jgi:hypothetical protein